MLMSRVLAGRSRASPLNLAPVMTLVARTHIGRMLQRAQAHWSAAELYLCEHEAARQHQGRPIRLSKPQLDQCLDFSFSSYL